MTEPPASETQHARLRGGRRWPLLGAVVSLTLLVLLAAAWRWTPAGEAISAAELDRLMQAARESPLAPLAVAAAYMLAGPLFLPMSLLTLATFVTFGPVLGFAYSLTASMLSATTTFALARWFGVETARNWLMAGRHPLPERLRGGGFLFLVAIRMVPLVPFNMVNLASAASGMPLRRFSLGTALGMTPGKVAAAVLVDRLTATVREPDAPHLALLGAVTLGIAGIAVTLHLWAKRRARLDGA